MGKLSDRLLDQVISDPDKFGKWWKGTFYWGSPIDFVAQLGCSTSTAREIRARAMLKLGERTRPIGDGKIAEA